MPDPRDHLLPDNERIVLAIYDETKRLAESQEQMRTDVQTLTQTVFGPPGSQNGLYRMVKDLGERLDELKTWRVELLAEAKAEAKHEVETARTEAQLALKKARQARIIAALIGLGGVIVTLAANYLASHK